MKQHTKIYCDFFGYGEQSFIGCEVCGKEATGGIHHLVFKSRSTVNPDRIENIMALCSEHHRQAHDSTLSVERLQQIHDTTMIIQDHINL